MTAMTQRDVDGTIGWYRANEAWPAAIGFDPDGMCMKICRTARNIGPGAASALVSQNMTPPEFRVHQINKIKRGMVGYFDDPNDSNPFGHIVTFVARIKDADPDSLSSLLVRTNSVVSNKLVVVRADFFGKHWGDSFQFAGTWINGVPLIFPEEQPPPAPRPLLTKRGTDRLREILEMYDGLIEQHQDDERLVRALRRDKREVAETLRLKEAS
jgi:hypothetical protein